MLRHFHIKFLHVMSLEEVEQFKSNHEIRSNYWNELISECLKHQQMTILQKIEDIESLFPMKSNELYRELSRHDWFSLSADYITKSTISNSLKENKQPKNENKTIKAKQVHFQDDLKKNEVIHRPSQFLPPKQSEPEINPSSSSSGIQGIKTISNQDSLSITSLYIQELENMNMLEPHDMIPLDVLSIQNLWQLNQSHTLSINRFIGKYNLIDSNIQRLNELDDITKITSMNILKQKCERLINILKACHRDEVLLNESNKILNIHMNKICLILKELYRQTKSVIQPHHKVFYMNMIRLIELRSDVQHQVMKYNDSNMTLRAIEDIAIEIQQIEYQNQELDHIMNETKAKDDFIQQQITKGKNHLSSMFNLILIITNSNE